MLARGCFADARAGMPAGDASQQGVRRRAPAPRVCGADSPAGAGSERARGRPQVVDTTGAGDWFLDRFPDK